MDNHNEIMRALGRIEGELVEIRDEVNSRGVGCLPIWHNYLLCHFAGDSRPVARKVRRLASVCSTWCFGE